MDIRYLNDLGEEVVLHPMMNDVTEEWIEDQTNKLLDRLNKE